MPVATRMIAFLLTVATLLALPAAHALPLLTSQSSHSAGCHGHNSSPSPAPTSYQCCADGHHIALPNSSFSLTPTAACSGKAHRDAGLPLSPSFVPTAALTVDCASPPSAVPLRI